MNKKTIIIFLLIGTVVSVLAAATIGLFEIPDSYFYYVLGEYLYNKNVLPVGPFNNSVPQTLFAPVYALIAHPTIARLPWGPQFLLPTIQLIMVIVACILTTVVIQKLFSKKIIPLGVMIFLFLPFNIVYAFMFMSETTTMFFVSLYLFFLVQFKKSLWKNSFLVLISGILVLTRYAFLPLFSVSLLWWVIKGPRKLITIIPGVLGVSIIGLWVLLHINLYHAPLLSTFTGRHLYDNVITTGKFVPHDRSNPDVASFFSYLPPGADITHPWWDIEPFFANPFYQGKVTELQVDHMFMAVSLEGIKENPIPYAINLLKLSIVTPNTAPYHDNVLTQIGFSEPTCVTCSVKQCRFMWMTQFCEPIYPSTFAQSIFGYFLMGNQAMYPIVSGILFVLALVGICSSLIKKNKLLILIVAIFLMQHIFQSATEWVEGRFLLPLYPLYTVLIVEGIITTQKIIKLFIEKMQKDTSVSSA